MVLAKAPRAMARAMDCIGQPVPALTQPRRPVRRSRLSTRADVSDALAKCQCRQRPDGHTGPMSGRQGALSCLVVLALWAIAVCCVRRFCST